MSKLLKSFSTTKKTAEPVTIECPPTLVLKEPFLKKRRICSRRVRNPNEADRGGTCTRSSVKSVLESLINRDCSWMTHRIRHAVSCESRRRFAAFRTSGSAGYRRRGGAPRVAAECRSAIRGPSL